MAFAKIMQAAVWLIQVLVVNAVRGNPWDRLIQS